MIKQLKKAAHRTLIWLIAATMVLGLTTDAMITTTKAYGSDSFEKVTIEDEDINIYLYGADKVEEMTKSDQKRLYTIKYTGGTEAIDSSYVIDGESVNDVQGITLSQRTIEIDLDELNVKEWIAFKCDTDSAVSLPLQEPTDENHDPKIEIEYDLNPDDKWSNEIEVTITVTSESEIASCILDDDPVTLDENGQFIFTMTKDEYLFSATDINGNEAQKEIKADKFDGDAPVFEAKSISIKYMDQELTEDNYLRPDIEYSFVVNATDNSKGALQYSIDNQTWQGKNEFKLKGAASYTFYIKDEAGNISSCEKNFKIDADKPIINSIKSYESWGLITYIIEAHDNTTSLMYGYREQNTNGVITWQGKNLFTFRGSNAKKEYEFFVKDGASPEHVVTSTTLNVQDKAPKIKSVEKSTDLPTKDPIQVTISAQADGNKTIVAYGYTKDKISENAINLEELNIVWKDADVEKEDEYIFYVEDADLRQFLVKDSNGAISYSDRIEFSNYDIIAPTLKNVSFERTNDDPGAKIINFLSFGMFLNENVEMKITAVDEAGEVTIKDENENSITKSSGKSPIVKDYKVIFTPADETADKVEINGEFEYNVKNEAYEGTISLKHPSLVNFKGKIEVQMWDEAGNESVIQVTSDLVVNDENDIGLKDFTIENTAPIIDLNEQEIQKYHKDDFYINFKVSDDKNADECISGLATVKVEVNGKEVFSKDYLKEKEIKPNDSYSLSVNVDEKAINNVDMKKNWKNGRLNVKITAYDNAGNATVFPAPVENGQEKEYVLYIDQTAPKVTKFEFGTDPNESASGEGIKDKDNTVQIKEYGFYFKENTKLRIYASDSIGDNESKASGLSEICVYLQSFDETFTFNSAGDLVKINDTNEAVKLIPEGENDYVEVIIPANYKGQIYAKAVDGVGNESSYVHPDGTIIENEDQHKSSSEIKIVASKPSGTQINKPTEYNLEGIPADSTLSCDMSKNVPLYSENPTFSISAIDSYSGIQELTWTIIEGEKETSHSISVNNDGELNLDKSEGSLAVGTESNLVTSLDISELQIEGNSNDMVLLVELTDNAGNKSYDYYVFGIDKTNPVINVAYDNNNGDTKSNDGNTYFAADRTATVTVKERNFDPENTNVEVYANGKKVAVRTDWNLTENSGNGDETTYSINISYKEDADYTFKIDSTDRAGLENDGVNYGESVAGDKFTIDKTAPVVSVSYNNNSANNEKYFNANRTATVVIKEHNFDENRIVWTRTASLSGAPISMPGITWKHNGDTHTATIAYNADGDYTFDVSMEDKAGNKNKTVNYGSSVAAKDFVIDTHIDEPTITGVSNGYAYKDIVLPGIDFTDVNFDMSDIRITRTRLGQRDVDVTSEYIGGLSVGGQGISGVMDTFDKIREKDGIYTLYVRVVDKAGNESSNTATFTVNRFGSVYAYNQTLSDLVKDGGAYVQSVKGNLVITEYNPDKLLEGSLIIEITRDGKPISNPIYKVAPVINENVAIGESGWFQYQYTIDPENFKQDGVYKISISSKDATGNTPEIANYDDLDILFRVDNSLPELTSVVGLEKSIINANQVEVKYQVFDAIGIKSVAIYIDGKLIDKVTDFAGDLNNYTGTFVISESSSRQNVQIVVEDLAGNITDTNAEGFTSAFDFEKNVTVSTNFVIRWFANKPLFFGSIAVIAVAIGGLWFFIIGKKKNNEDEQ